MKEIHHSIGLGKATGFSTPWTIPVWRLAGLTANLKHFAGHFLPLSKQLDLAWERGKMKTDDLRGMLMTMNKRCIDNCTAAATRCVQRVNWDRRC